MFNSLNRQRVSWILLLTGVALIAYYAIVYRPLSNMVYALDKPLTNVWSQTIVTNPVSGIVEGVDFEGTSQDLRKAQAARRALAQQRESILSRIVLEPEIQSRLNQPFQLLDFQNERQVRADEITQLAKQNRVSIGPEVEGVYPRYTAIEGHPTELWAELAIVHQALATAIHSKVSSIRSAKLLDGQSHPALGPSQPGLLEVRLTLDISGPMAAVSRFLVALPLTGREMQTAGLPSALTNKPALFIDRWMLRKAAPDKPNDVELELVISGFANSQTRHSPLQGS